jgi:putative transposase
MKRVAPSTRLKQEIQQLLAAGLPPAAADDRAGPSLRPAPEDPAGQLVRLAARLVLQEALEQEQADFLGRSRYERTPQARGHRNGYAQAALKTAEGRLDVALPQVRGAEQPLRSRLMAFLGEHTDLRERLAVEMYARGLSTRDVEAAFTDSTGAPLLSKSGVSELTEALWEEYEAFQKHDLSGYEVEYLFVDAIYESLREQAGAKEAVLCCWAILRDGSKVLLHLALGNKESYQDWLGFLRSMVSRGLAMPVAVTSDGAPGLLRALGETFPRSLRLRCWFHKMQNVLCKLPKSAIEEVRAHRRAIRDAPTLLVGQQMAASFIEEFGGKYPSAVASFADDLEASLAHLRLPVEHRLYCRTTNLVERSFVEERRRTKVIPRFRSEKSCLKLVFATLIRASRRWSRVRMTELHQAQLERLRQELGQVPPPPTSQERGKLAA